MLQLAKLENQTARVAFGLAAMLAALSLLPVSKVWGEGTVGLFTPPPMVDKPKHSQPRANPTLQLESDPIFAPEKTAPLRPASPVTQAPQVSPEATLPIVPPIGIESPRDTLLQPQSNDPLIDTQLDFTPALEEISQRLQPEVKAGFDLGRAGALFAARRQFIAVLRKVALAKDAAESTENHSTALAEGLRALDEADDFIPRGEALEAELNTLAIARSHTTPVVRLSTSKRITPHQAVALYAQYASDRLAAATTGEQAGSMALYGLGKTYARLAAHADDRYAARKSAVLYRASLGAHRDNYLAANELGVYLARAGRYEQAAPFLRMASSHPSAPATVHANLAMVQQQTGEFLAAAETQQTHTRLAQSEMATQEISRRHGVEWVAADTFRGAPAATAPSPSPTTNTAPPAIADWQEPEEQGWRGWMTQAKRAAGWTSSDNRQAESLPASPPTTTSTAGTPPMRRVTR